MQVTLESTDKIVHLDGVPARLWQGTAANGVPVHAFITRVAIDENQPAHLVADFEQQLQVHQPPRPEFEVYPLRLLL